MNDIKVQVVEDEAFTAEYIKEMLVNLGYRVSSVVDSGRKAIQAAERDRPDIILMDIFLEGDLDGIEAAKLIHAQFEIPVIFITAQEDMEIIERAKEASSYGFLIKAFEERDLRVSIEMALHAAYADARRRKAEKALRESEERLNAFMDSATDIFFLFDADLRLVLANNAGLALFPPGTMKEDIVGLYAEDLLPGDFKDGRIERFRDVVRTGMPHFSGDIPALSLLGNTHINIKAFRAADGLGLIIRDITKRKTAETEKEKLENLLLQSQKMEAVSTLAEGIVHDFQNLLHVIGGNAEMLLETAGDGAKAGLNAVMESVRTGSETIRQILAFSRQYENRMAVVNLNDEINRIKHLLDRAMPRMIEFRLNLDPELAATFCDPARMEQVLMEFCFTARDAMPEGGRLTVTTENRILDEGNADHERAPDIPPGRYVLLTVSDTGEGIDPALVDQAFNPSGIDGESGAGNLVGLSVIHSIVKSFKGFVACDTHPDRGTTFFVYLPAVEDATEEDALFESPDVSVSEAGTGSGVILVVDDEENVLHLTGSMMERLGYRAVTADSGEAALDIYIDRMNEIDLILLDMNMPGMGGRRCLQRILMLNPEARVVIASGYLQEGLSRELLDLGASACLIKPYSKFELSRTLYSVLNEGRRV